MDESLKAKLVRSKLRARSLWTLVGNSVGAMLSIALLYVAVYLFKLNLSDIQLIWWPALLPISALVWAIALLSYFLRELRMFHMVPSSLT
jgi:hypothetical protein